MVASGAYLFDDVILGDYVIIAEPFSGSEYLPTYHYNEIQWDEADEIILNVDTAGVDILMVGPPPELTPDDGNGVFDGFVEETITDGESGGRLEAGRRVRRAGVLLKRRPPDSRPDNDDGFEVIAYVQTDDNGEFSIDNLPVGTYRIFIEYPGIPMDTTSFVEFELGVDLDENEVSIAAVVTEDGIQVELVEETGVPYNYIENLNIYPNPAKERLFIQIDSRNYFEIDLEILDMRGVSMIKKRINPYTLNGNELEIDVSSFDQGLYIIRVTVPEYNDQAYKVGKLTIR